MHPVLCKVHPSSSQHYLAVTASGKNLGSDYLCPPTASPVLPAAAVSQLRCFSQGPKSLTGRLLLYWHLDRAPMAGDKG